LRTRFQISEDALDGCRSRIAPVTQIKYKSRISNDISSETGWRCVIAAQEFFHFSEQIHR